MQAVKKPTIRQAQKKLTRDKLIAAAAECLVQSGYQSTTIDSITANAGATRATFYLHFESKAEIAAAIWAVRIDGPTQDLWARLSQIMVTFDDRPMILREEWFPDVIAHWRERGALVSALWDAAPLEQFINTELNTTRQKVADIIVDALSSRVRHTGTALRIRAIAAFELQTQMFLNWIAGHVPHDEQALIEALGDGWEGLLG